jgi:hypothetical protein
MDKTFMILRVCKRAAGRKPLTTTEIPGGPKVSARCVADQMAGLNTPLRASGGYFTDLRRRNLVEGEENKQKETKNGNCK